MKTREDLSDIGVPIQYLESYPFPACVISKHWPIGSSPELTVAWANTQWAIFATQTDVWTLLEPSNYRGLTRWLEQDSDIEPDFTLQLSHPAHTFAVTKTAYTPPASTSASPIIWVISGLGRPKGPEITPRQTSSVPSSPFRTVPHRAHHIHDQDIPSLPGTTTDCKQLLAITDWSKTSLGPRETWSPVVETMIGVIMRSATQDALWLGPDFEMIYNQHYSNIVHHPILFGKSAKDPTAWGPVWDGVKHLIDKCLTEGEPCYREDDLLLYRKGPTGHFVEKYHTWSFVPLFDADGKPLGLFNPTIETTRAVLARRRQETLRDLSNQVAVSRTQKEYFGALGEVLGQNAKDIPFAIVYAVDTPNASAPEELKLTQHITVGVPPDHPAAPTTLTLSVPKPTHEASGRLMSSPALSAISTMSTHSHRLQYSDNKTAWPIRQALRSRHCVVMSDCKELVTGFELRQWDVLPESAIIVPFCSDTSMRIPDAVMILGINLQGPVDDDYEEWVHLLKAHLTSSLASVRAIEAETERLLQNERLARAQTNWFQGAAHDLRSPLTLVAGPLDDILRTSLTPAQRQSLTLAQRHVARIQRLVNSLLDFSRIEAGKMKAYFMPVDVGIFVKDLATMFKPAAEKRNLKMAIAIARYDGTVSVDPTLFETVITNLISNAVKYTAEGSIGVSVTYDRHAEIAISDTGCGIPVDELDGVTDRFQRASTAIGVEGSGIGLALSKEIIKLHNGELYITSKTAEDSPNDHGSVFTVRIPLVDRSSTGEGPANFGFGSFGKQMVKEALHDREASESEFSLSKTDMTEETAGEGLLFDSNDLLLIADDNDEIRTYIRGIFKPYCQVIEARNGREALVLARERRPHLVLSDLMMPVMNGNELLAAIRDDADLRSTPVVMLSAATNEELRLTAFVEHAVEDFLLKPFKPRELLARVHIHMQLGKKRAFLEESFAAKEMDLKLLSDYCPSGIVRADPDGTLVYANAAWRSYMGMPADEDISSWTSYIESPVFERIIAPWKELVRGERSELSLTWKWSNGITVAGTFIRLDTKDGVKARGILGCLQDITYQEERVMEAEKRRVEAEEAKKQQEMLVDMTSHEIRTPVSAILQCSALVKENLINLREQLVRSGTQGLVADVVLLDELDQDVEALESIHQCGLVQERIAGDILSLARIQLDMLSLHYTPMDIRKNAKQVVQSFASEAKSQKVELDLKFGSSLSRCLISSVKTDHVRLGQIVTNLISNAMKFTAISSIRRISVKYDVAFVPPEEETCEPPEVAHTHLVAPTEDTPVWLFVSVTDSGPGLGRAERVNLFKRFSQGSKMIHTQYGGSGLGLFICRKITELLGGRIEVQSTVGQGSTFRFFIEARSSSQTASALPPASPRGGPEANPASARQGTLDESPIERVPTPVPSLHVLIVEDNIINQTVLYRQLTKAGWMCEVANNGQEALDKMASRRDAGTAPYDVILMDLEMPIMDGITAVKRIRRAEAVSKDGQRQLVIALTGNARQAQIDHAQESGMDDVMIKPYKLPVLLVKVKAAIEAKKGRRLE